MHGSRLVGAGYLDRNGLVDWDDPAVPSIDRSNDLPFDRCGDVITRSISPLISN